MVECNFIWEYTDKEKIDIGEIYNGQKEAMEKARVVAWNKLYRREIIEKAGIVFPEGLCYEDIEFFYKVLPNLNKIGFVKEPLIHYVQRWNSISNYQTERTAEIFQVLDNVISYYKEKGLFEEYKEQLEYTYTRILLCSSLKRITKIKDKKLRMKLINKTWINLKTNFPDWKKNNLLKKKSNKNLYMRSINGFTFHLYKIVFYFK